MVDPSEDILVNGTRLRSIFFNKKLTPRYVHQHREDLADQAKAGTDLSVFRKEGFDF